MNFGVKLRLYLALEFKNWIYYKDVEVEYDRKFSGEVLEKYFRGLIIDDG